MGGLPRGSRFAPAVVAALVLITAAGCGFFDIRDPISAVPGSGPPRRDPSSPDSVLFNYENAVRYKLVGQGQFEEAQSELADYVFRLDPGDALDVGLESMSFATMVQAYNQAATELADSFYFAFAEERQTDTNTGTEATYSRLEYVFQLLTPVTADSATVRESYGGAADLKMRLENGNWVIVEWNDFIGGSADRTWGFFLGNRASPS